MKTVKFRDLPLENRVFNKEEKDDGNHIHQMTTEITSPSSAQWLENFDDQGESCIALHMWQLAVGLSQETYRYFCVRTSCIFCVVFVVANLQVTCKLCCGTILHLYLYVHY